MPTENTPLLAASKQGEGNNPIHARPSDVSKLVASGPGSGLGLGLQPESEPGSRHDNRLHQGYSAITTDDIPCSSNSNTSTDGTLTDDSSVDNDLEISPARVKAILVSMYLGVFLASLDSTIVTTLIGHIASEFNALPKLSWIATAYLVSSATFQPLYGKLSDIFGRRSLLLFVNFLFTIGCFICYTSTNVETLILGRFISGAGGGGLTSLASITTSDIVPLKSRGIYQGITNVAFALGTAIGGFLGGLCSDNLGWRFAFLIQVPISVLSGLCIFWFLNLPTAGETDDKASIKYKLKLIDWLGSLSLIVFLLLFLTVTSFGGKELAFDSKWFLTMIIVTAISLFSFVYIELKVAKNPILPLSFMTIPTILGVFLSNFFISVSSLSSYFILPLYFTAVMNLNSTEIGKRFSPNFFSIIAGSLGCGIYTEKTGKYRNLLILSGLLSIFGMFRYVTINENYSTLEQYLLMFTPGLGFAVIITATLLALIAAVPHEHQASTTSISYLFRSMGSALGVSIGSALFGNKLNKELTLNVLKHAEKGYDLEYLEEIIYNAEHSPEYVNAGAPEWIRAELVTSYERSSVQAFKFSLVTVILAFASLFLIKEHVLHQNLKRK